MDMLLYGAVDIDTPADTRYLPIGFSLVTAPATAIGFRADAEATCLRMRVRHNTPSADATTVTYTLYVNGVATAVAVTLAANASDGSNTADDADIFPGDLIELRALKNGVLTTGVIGPFVSVGIE